MLRLRIYSEFPSVLFCKLNEREAHIPVHRDIQMFRVEVHLVIHFFDLLRVVIRDGSSTRTLSFYFLPRLWCQRIKSIHKSSCIEHAGEKKDPSYPWFVRFCCAVLPEKLFNSIREQTPEEGKSIPLQLFQIFLALMSTKQTTISYLYKRRMSASCWIVLDVLILHFDTLHLIHEQTRYCSCLHRSAKTVDN